MIKIYSFHSINPGKKVLILGAIHGNEPCGTIAIKKIINLIEKGNINLLKGSITLIPISNPKAFELKQRFVEKNLARVFGFSGDSYEEQIAGIIKNIAKQHDVILDIHSMYTNGDPFCFQDYDGEKYDELVNATGFKQIIKGWPQMYEGSKEIDVTGYAKENNIPSVVIECGQHLDPMAGKLAFDSIKNVLQYYGMIYGEFKIKKKSKIITMKKIFYKTKEGEMSKKFVHGEKIGIGEILVRYKDGENIVSDSDGYIILPKHNAKTGEERFYMGK